MEEIVPCKLIKFDKYLSRFHRFGVGKVVWAGKVCARGAVVDETRRPTPFIKMNSSVIIFGLNVGVYLKHEATQLLDK